MAPRGLACVVLLVLISAPGCGDDARGPVVPELPVRDDAGREADDTLRRARRLVDADAPDDAEPLLRRALELDPRHAEARRLLARVLVDQRRYTEAIPLLRELLAQAPANVSLHESLTYCLHVTGDLSAAETAYGAWLEVDPANDDAHFGLGQVLYDLGRYEEAVRSFRRAEKRRAGRADVRSELGLALQALGKLEEAETKQRDALERNPRSAEAWFRLGDVISRRDPARSNEAIEAMREAVRLDPRHVHAQLYLYRLLRQAVRAGRPELEAEATRRWRSVLRSQRQRQVGRRAGAPRVQDTGARREKRLRDRVREQPDDLVARRELAELLHADGALDAALAEYEALLESGQDDAALLAAVGAASLATGRAARAIEILEQVIALPDAPASARRQLAWALLCADRADEALARYDQLLAATPEDVSARLGRGLTLMRLERLDEGLQEIAAAGWLR